MKTQKKSLTGATEEMEKELKESSVPYVPPVLNSGPMHPLFQKATGLTERIIAAAIDVHRG